MAHIQTFLKVSVPGMLCHRYQGLGPTLATWITGMSQLELSLFGIA